MKKFIILFLLVGASNLYSKQVDCTDNSCEIDFVPEEKIDKAEFSSIDIGQNNEEDIFVISQPEEKPRSVRIYLENNKTSSVPVLSADLSASSSDFNGADFLLIGDVLGGLDVKLDGFKGSNGKDASELCAEKFKLGSNGGFGDVAKSEFELRRLIDPGIDENKCVDLDIEYLQDNNFSCGSSDFFEVDSQNPTVNVERLRGKTRCLGLSFNDVCLSKSVEVSCNWKVRYLEPSAVAGQISSDPDDSEVKTFVMPEKEWNEKKNEPGFYEYLCNNATSIPSDPPSEELFTNPQFNFNAAGWNLNQSVWVEETRSVKTLGGPTQVVKPTISQIVETDPGKKYRIKATWNKAEEESFVSSSRISIWNNSNKDSLIERNEFYEPGAIGPVHLVSNPTYHHFDYLEVNNFSSTKAFGIINNDDRLAQNCSAPYLDGDSSEFSIVADNCGGADLEVGESCVIEVQAHPTSVGRKTTLLKRDCSDSYSNTTTLETKIEVQGYENYPFGVDCLDEPDCNNLDFNPTYTDGEWWRLNGGDWQTWGIVSCDGKSPNSRNNDQAFVTGAICEEAPDKLSCSCSDFDENNCACSIGYYNDIPNLGLFIGNVPEIPDTPDFPIVNNSDINSGVRQSQKDFDFTFVAENNQTLIEYSPILKFHSGYIDDFSLEEVSPNAGPSIKPEKDAQGDYIANVAGSEGNGYFELINNPISEITQPGFDSVFYTVPEQSDWEIRYVNTGDSCPNYYDKIKENHLASLISFDDNDNLCDDVSTPEDPEGLVIDWRDVGFDRSSEFGTETVQCRIDNCPVRSQTRDVENTLATLNPSSGADGTQQGGGSIFLYDVFSTNLSSENGSAGVVGEDDILKLQDRRVCARVRDAETQGVDSEFAPDPSVLFQRNNWQALKVKETGNFGNQPENNGKSIKIYKKIDSSVRFLMKNELL